MISPGMVRIRPATRAGRIECPAKVGKREQSHALVNALNYHLVIKSPGGLAELGYQIALCRNLVIVRIEAAKLAIKDLPANVQVRAYSLSNVQPALVVGRDLYSGK